MAQNVYELLLGLGAPPETIQRLMAQMKGGSPLFQSGNVGMRGNPAGFKPVVNSPQGIYRSPTPPRV
uniref:Uncharacterized protein n=1 Tax=viral metagenome TaxID=1070528 RepID=A0A6M3LNK6_9ZZZZ